MVVDCGDADDAEVVAAGDRDRGVVEVFRPDFLVLLDPERDLDRPVVVDRVAAEDVRVAELGRVIAGRGTGDARAVAHRHLAAERQAVERRRVVAHRVAEPRVEAAVGLRVSALCPQRRRRQDRRRVGRDVAEDGVQIVQGHQEVAHLERAPATLEADERFAIGRHAAAGVALDVRLDLEERREAASQRFGATDAQARRVRAEPRYCRVRAVGLSAAHEFEVDVEPAVQRDVRGLRMCCERSAENACDGDSNELLFH